MTSSHLRPSNLFGTFRLATLVVGGALLMASAQAQLTGPRYQLEEAPATESTRPAAVRFDTAATDVEGHIDDLLAEMTLAEKIGQLVQVCPDAGDDVAALHARIRRGQLGSIFYTGNLRAVEKAQRIARDDSRLGIPLIIARDVVHGFHTIMPIPLGQAASWNPALVEEAARCAASEAQREGIQWTFAPMVDISRDPRWGRVAESLGEDPLLASQLAAAMVQGFQQQRDGKLHGIAACAKHFVGYGLAEGGRDYNRALVSQNELHNVYLPPFRQCVDIGCRSVMTAFNEVNGVPGTAQKALVSGLLKDSWRFDGVVVSDWGAVSELVVHGLAADDAEATKLALEAGVDIDMCSPAFAGHLQKLVESGEVRDERLDDAVRRVLRLKLAFVEPRPRAAVDSSTERAANVSRELARQSVVLLKNRTDILPLNLASINRIAVIGPMANEGQQQLGCWAIDGVKDASVTPLVDLRERLAETAEVVYARGARSTFDASRDLIGEAVEAASKADVALLFVGEDATLSGEARSRASIDLPGVQEELIRRVAATNTPCVLVFLAGRPLTIGSVIDQVDAALFAWHPGTMAGPAINDLLLGVECPSGKLPMTFPRDVGQVPMYYSHPQTGRPQPADYQPLIGSNDQDLPQQFQYRSHYLDQVASPLFPFGFGLSYATFRYEKLLVGQQQLDPDDDLVVSTVVTNTGGLAATEVVQLYTQDVTARIVRPVRELTAFRRVHLLPGQSRRVEFRVPVEELGYLDDHGVHQLEAGKHRAWIGGDSATEESVEFAVRSQ